MATGQTNNEAYGLGRYTDFITGEFRALTSRSYDDPLVLCFKVMMDYDKTYGLLADESYTDSALAYLNRIGDTVRYQMLRQWIMQWKAFFRDYDFLLQSVEGLNVVQNTKPQDAFTEEDELTFTIRETLDMRFQALMTTYRAIWHDDIRCVEVLPANLRRFDMYVLVYSSGYFNQELYDIVGGATTGAIPVKDIDRYVFPTFRKLSDQQFSMGGTMQQFNHMLFIFGDVSIVNEKTGSNFASTVSNEMSSDYVKNNLVLTYRFASYKGRFNNLMGNIDFSGMLAIAAAQSRTKNVSNAMASLTQQLVESLKDYGTNRANSVAADGAQSVGKKLLSKNTFLGSLTSGISAENAATLIKNTFDLGLNYVQDKFINNPIAKLNNLISNNFGDNIYTLIGDNTNNIKPGISLAENVIVGEDRPIAPHVAETVSATERAIKYGEYNVFERKGF